MYYKITNKESDIFKKLFEMRISEKEKAERNLARIVEEAGSDFDTNVTQGHRQQNFRRVPQYIGFGFLTPETLKNPKAWKVDKDHSDIYVPNTRTKAGREFKELLDNGLEAGSYRKVDEILGIENDFSRFRLPYVEITDDNETICLFLDDKIAPTNYNVIEITSKEFHTLLEIK